MNPTVKVKKSFGILLFAPLQKSVVQQKTPVLTPGEGAHDNSAPRTVFWFASQYFYFKSMVDIIYNCEQKDLLTAHE